MQKIIITAGDPKGVGFEVSAKSLNDLGPSQDHCFTLVISKNHYQNNYIDLLKKKFKLQFVEDFNVFNGDYNELQILERNDPPSFWVESALKHTKDKPIHALVTGPISKIESNSSLNINGHTELFRKYYDSDLFMCFIGKFFNTLLITDHLPLRDAMTKLNAERYTKAIELIHKLPLANKSIAFLGINPHAGEQGLLGQEETLMLVPLINKLRKSHSNYTFSDPLPGDTAFLKKNWAKYSLFICPFHDIGLSAFKTIHGLNDGIQVTLGLPFLRTSVDHGTASDIFNKDTADFGSMKLAINYAIKGQL